MGLRFRNFQWKSSGRRGSYGRESLGRGGSGQASQRAVPYSGPLLRVVCHDGTHTTSFLLSLIFCFHEEVITRLSPTIEVP